jgi:hypothetical protein
MPAASDANDVFIWLSLLRGEIAFSRRLGRAALQQNERIVAVS